MTLLPVVERELRTSARQPFTYTLRILGVGALLGVSVFFGFAEGFAQDSGGRLFAWQHTTLFVTIWVLVPFLAADAVSRERREGTLVLLALTPLSSLDVVLAKAFANGLRAFSLWLVVLPVLAISVMVGGVSWLDGVASVLVNFTSLGLALASGLLASSLSRVFTRALVLAVALASVSFMGFLFGAAFLKAVAVHAVGAGLHWDAGMDTMFHGLSFVLNYDQIWSQVTTPPARASLLWGLVILTAVFLFLANVLVRIAARIVRRSWRGEPGSRLGTWFETHLCRPVFFTGLLKRWMRRELLHNPLSWLEQRTWSGRLVLWSWLAVVASIYSYFLLNYSLFFRGFGAMQVFLSWLLVLSIAASAAGSFRRERDSGVLELLLVAPLSEWQLIGGRLRALWMRFMPSAVLLCGIWVYVGAFMPAPLNPSSPSLVYPVFLFVVAFLCLPVVGLYFSLAVPSFISAFLRTLGLTMIIPVAATVFGFNSLLGPLWQTAAAAACGWLLHRRLKSRTFHFQH